jgi:hypothetical protein
MMRRGLVVGLLVMCVGFGALSQPKVRVNVRGDSCLFSPRRAAFMYFCNNEQAVRETTILVYIKQGFYWQAPRTYDTTSRRWYEAEYHFSIDSITGRGDNRKALFTEGYKVDSGNPLTWVWIVKRLGTFIPDTARVGAGYAPVLWDTLARYSDSTRKVSIWLTYSRRIFDPNYGWYTYAGTTPVEEWWGWWEGKPYNWRATIRMEKILGDPTKNFGWDQRAVLKMALFQVPNDSLYQAVVGPSDSW